MLGEDHPGTRLALNNIGVFHFSQGNFQEALVHTLQSLDLHTKSLGHEHPQTQQDQRNLGDIYAALGDVTSAAEAFESAVIGARVWAEQEADFASGSFNRSVALNRAGLSDDFALAFAVHAPAAETAELAALVVLNRKGLIGEREAALLRLARSAETGAAQQIAAELLVARRDLSAAYQQVVRGDGGESFRARWSVWMSWRKI